MTPSASESLQNQTLRTVVNTEYENTRKVRVAA